MGFWKSVALLLSSVGLLSASDRVDFVGDIRPIFESHCYSCHGPDKQKSGLRLDIKAAAFKGGEYYPPTIAVGEPEKSTLIHVISGKHKELRMPPKGPGLNKEEIGKLSQWDRTGSRLA